MRTHCHVERETEGEIKTGIGNGGWGVGGVSADNGV